MAFIKHLLFYFFDYDGIHELYDHITFYKKITRKLANSKIDKEFSFQKNSQVQAVLVDATTQEQLDTVIIKKSNIRDLGGLL